MRTFSVFVTFLEQCSYLIHLVVMCLVVKQPTIYVADFNIILPIVLIIIKLYFDLFFMDFFLLICFSSIFLFDYSNTLQVQSLIIMFIQFAKDTHIDTTYKKTMKRSSNKSRLVFCSTFGKYLPINRINVISSEKGLNILNIFLQKKR